MQPMHHHRLRTQAEPASSPAVPLEKEVLSAACFSDSNLVFVGRGHSTGPRTFGFNRVGPAGHPEERSTSPALQSPVGKSRKMLPLRSL